MLVICTVCMHHWIITWLGLCIRSTSDILFKLDVTTGQDFSQIIVMKFIWSLWASKPFIKERLCQHLTRSKQMPTLINSQPICCPLTALAISSHRRSDSAQLGMQRQRYVGENWEDRLCTLPTIIWGKSMQKYMFWCCSNAARNHQNYVLLMSLQLCFEVFYVDSGTNYRLEYYVALFFRL